MKNQRLITLETKIKYNGGFQNAYVTQGKLLGFDIFHCGAKTLDVAFGHDLIGRLEITPQLDLVQDLPKLLQNFRDWQTRKSLALKLKSQLEGLGYTVEFPSRSYDRVSIWSKGHPLGDIIITAGLLLRLDEALESLWNVYKARLVVHGVQNLDEYLSKPPPAEENDPRFRRHLLRGHLATSGIMMMAAAMAGEATWSRNTRW